MSMADNASFQIQGAARNSSMLFAVQGSNFEDREQPCNFHLNLDVQDFADQGKIPNPVRFLQVSFKSKEALKFSFH